MGVRSWIWKETAWLQDGHKSPLYCCAFNHFNRAGGDLVATVGGSRASVYCCLPGGGLQAVQVFKDEDPKEEYYACAWSLVPATGAPLLLLAGKKALLQVVNCLDGWLERTLEGHGQAVNAIAVHPTRPQLVATASRDTAVRLWNLATGVCVLILQGDGGHRSEVLSLDWHPGGGFTLVSAGMDSCVKVWNLGAHAATLDASDAWDSGAATRAFPTRLVTVPAFSTEAAHWNYVDCVRWLGDFLLTKSVDSRVVCWAPDPDAGPGAPTTAVGSLGRGGGGGDMLALARRNGAVRLIQEMQLEDCRNMWWLRFSLDYWCQVLAVGTVGGRVLVFDPHGQQAEPRARLKPHRATGKNDSTLLVRQTGVSFDGSIIVACHEDGSITRFDIHVGPGTGAAQAEQERQQAPQA